jgi:hypothetical protein
MFKSSGWVLAQVDGDMSMEDMEEMLTKSGPTPGMSMSMAGLGMKLGGAGGRRSPARDSAGGGGSGEDPLSAGTKEKAKGAAGGTHQVSAATMAVGSRAQWVAPRYVDVAEG